METAEILKKIRLVGLSDEEEKKALEKFPDLAFCSEEEIQAVLDLLAKKGEKITKARELKILTNPVGKLERNFDFIEEVHELGIYSEDLNRLNSNGVDIFKRIRYCNQFNISYKNNDGTYKEFIFKESLFQKEINNTTTLEDNKEKGDSASKNNEPKMANISRKENEKEMSETEHQDIHEYMQAESELNNIESQTTTFAQIKQDLEAQLAELDALRNQNEQQEYNNGENVYHFNDYADIEGETYNVGRGRAA